MSTESPLWLLAISVKLQAVALLSLCMAVRITACALSAAFSACRFVTSVWRFQVRLKMLLEETLALTFFLPKYEKTGCCEWRFAYLTGTPVRQLSGNHDTDSMYTPTCTSCNLSRNTAYRANSYDTWGTQQKVCRTDRFLWFF